MNIPGENKSYQSAEENSQQNKIIQAYEGLKLAYRKRDSFDKQIADTFMAEKVKEKTDAWISFCEKGAISLKNKTADEIVQFAKKYDKISLFVQTLFHSPRLAKLVNKSVSYTGDKGKQLKDFVGRHSTKTAAMIMLTGLLFHTINSTAHSTNDKKEELTENTIFAPEKALTMQDSIHMFGDYVATSVKLQSLNTVNSVGKEIKTAFGKYARFMRYEKEFDHALEEYGPSLQKDLVRGLAITEGEGNPVSINSMDGGAGILHIQPDVAKKDFHMKVFTDNKKYKQYDFYLLRKQGMSKHEIYAMHGKILKKILAENDGLSHVASLDDRFHPKQCLEKVVKQLEKNYNYGISIAKEKPALMKALRQYAKNTGQDRKQLYAINAFNKGPKSGYKSFTFGDTTKLRGHLENVLLHTSEYQTYDKIVKDGSAQGKEKEGLWQYLLEKTGEGQ